MYDMYPWDSSVSSGGRPPGTPRARRDGEPPRALDAVQVALDRRDNGGDAAAAPGRPPAGPTRQ